MSRSVKGDSTLQIDPWTHYSYSERRGKRLYDHYCSGCHGSSGMGDGLNGYALDPRPRRLADSVYVSARHDTTLKRSVILGGRGTNRSVLMPAFSHTLIDDEISFIVAYIRSFSVKNGRE